MTGQISWIRVARKDFEKFSQSVQERMIEVLALLSEGHDASNTKPLSNLGSGVCEITVAYRTVYALKLDDDVWVIHAFKKKSNKGIKTPKPDIDLIKQRIKGLKETLR
jgi:phage-related protein